MALSMMIIIPLVLHSILFLTGSTGNIFILTVHFLDWLKTDKLVSIHLIISCIGISNLFLQGSVAFTEVSALLFLKFYIQVWVANSLVVIMTSLALCSLWCSTCLCFYYCVKIISYNNTVFYKIKAKLPVFVPWLLVFSTMISWAAGLPAYWDVYVHIPLLTANATSNSSYVHLSYKSRCGCIYQVYMFISAVAFIVIIITAGAIIASLCKHMQKVRRNNQDFEKKLSLHLSATKTVTSLLVLYLIFYGALNTVYNDSQNGNAVIFLIAVIAVSIFPTGNAIILINGNAKLSNTLMRLLGLKPKASCTD